MAEIRYPFGEKLRAVRERKGWTMKEVGKKAGVSESLISQIERDKISPSLDTLFSLCDVLQIDLEYLFQNYKLQKKVSIVRHNERNRIEREKIIYEELSRIPESSEEHSLEAFLLRIGPEREKGDKDYGHPGKELGFIISGSGELFYGDHVYQLNEGDSVSFSSDMPHILKNTGTVELVALWVITPPHLFSK